MKRFGIFLVVLAVALQLPARAQTRETCLQSSYATLPSIGLERAVATQDRVNRYFHHTVVPKLTPCWESLTSKGSIAVRFEFERYGDHWLPGTSSVRNSTIPSEEASFALRCLQGAMGETSFAIDESDGESGSYVVNWSFPVPWPKDDAEAIVVAIDNGGGGGGGGCGGSENPPACFDCHFIPLLGLSLCAPTCVGYMDCVLNSDGNGCTLTPGRTRCITGRVFGNMGGVVIY
jgi:hypothetical protein